MIKPVRLIFTGSSMAELEADMREFLDSKLNAKVEVKSTAPVKESQPDVTPSVDEEEPEYASTGMIAGPSGPLVPPQMPAVPQSDGDLDSRGLPWDERIHAVTQGKNKDGTWRTRRGVEQSTIDKVEAELRKVQKSPAPMPAANPFGSTPPPAIPTFSPPSLAVVPPAPIAPPPPVVKSSEPVKSPQSIAPQLSVHTLETFKANLVATLAKLVADGKLTEEYVMQLKRYFNVDHIWKIDDAQLAEMFENFVANGLIVRA